MMEYREFPFLLYILLRMPNFFEGVKYVGSIFVTTLVTVLLLAIFKDDQHDQVCEVIEEYRLKTKKDVSTAVATEFEEQEYEQDAVEERVQLGTENSLLDGDENSRGEIEEKMMEEKIAERRQERGAYSHGSVQPESLQPGARVRQKSKT
jgi:hypothetical protein